ncbi:MAG: glycosyltransferase [Ignavibacterium album]|uniref:glycosyltransferase n=1 Tax=Ignavibacterium album TaxID=591197 RepID=UPI0026ED6D8E|nr:glycosyltransferase [Ignavibacterium album]MBI5661139.1 glycosyltransferase [Ignavibacterium album]
MNLNSNTILITAFGFQADYIREITNAFSRAGFKTILIGSNHHNKKWYEDKVEFINLRGDDTPKRSTVKKIKDLIIYFIKLYKFIVKNKIKKIYDTSIGRPLIIILNYLLLNLLRRKIILTVHNVLPHSEYTTKNKILYLIIYKFLTSKLIVHTSYIKNQLVNIFNIPENKIIVAPHGTYSIKDNYFINKQNARKKLNLEQNEFVILVFGQQYPYKGTDLLIKNYLNKIDFEFKLIIRGAGSKSYIETLINIIEKSNYKHNIDYDFNYVKETEVEYYFKSCDLVCLPYLEGSQSGVLFMSYAYGRPVLVSNVGNFKYDIIEGLTGEFFSLNDCEDFKDKLLRIKNNLSSYDENKIKEFANENYSWDKFADIIIKNFYC